MQLKRIQHYIARYKKFLESEHAYDRMHIWESQRIFQETWNMDHENLPAMYDESLQNSTTKRLWKREAYEPKYMMIEFLDAQPELMRHYFFDLFNEDKSIDGRMDRFVYYCDEMLREYKKAHPNSIENNHYHNDNYWMVSLYLAFKYPDNYCLYDSFAFRGLLRKLGSTDVPKTNDLSRFFKVMRTLYNFLQKEEGLMEAHQKRLDPEKHYMEKSLLLVYDFYQFCTSPKYSVSDFM